MKRVLTIFGTRPEAIKLAPVILELKKQSTVESRVCVTAQHREMLDQVLRLFNITPDLDLDLMQPDQDLPSLTARVLMETTRVLARERPDMVLIQGDTTTVMAAAMAAFYLRIPVGHVEAGLRSGNPCSPFPEEMNRRVTTTVSTLHFAPTERARQALLQEGVSDNHVFVTGNPVIDALQMIANQATPLKAKDLLARAGANGSSADPRLILVTAHRRENFGEGLEQIFRGLSKFVERNKDIVVIYPVHLNPNVQEPANRILGGSERILLTEPEEYNVLIHLMKASHIILTDSGGIQEEAPSLGKPVLVMRTETERPEGIQAGTAKLIGPYADSIVTETELLLRDKDAYQNMAKAVNPYGDGQAAKRIIEIIRSHLKITTG